MTASSPPRCLRRDALLAIEETTLWHILADQWRLERGEAALDRHLARRTGARPVGIALLDLDGSTAVRAVGRDAKLSLVGQTRGLLSTMVPNADLVIDNGQRDKTYVVLATGSTDELRTCCEQVREAIGRNPFVLPDGSVVRTTVSIGAVILEPRSALHAMVAARDATVLAKDHGGDTVEVDDRRGRSIADVDAQRMESALERGLSLLAEKHGPIWYWTVDRSSDTDGLDADLGPLQLSGAPRAVIELFGALVDQVRNEANGCPAPARAAPADARPLASLAVTRGAWARRVLNTTAARRHRSEADLLNEALALATLRTTIWGTHD